MDCGHPGIIQNGTVDVSGGTELDAPVQYSCDEGLSRSGSSTRTCQSDKLKNNLGLPEPTYTFAPGHHCNEHNLIA